MAVPELFRNIYRWIMPLIV